MTDKNRRVKDWPKKLSKKISEAKEKEFKRSKHDCLIWTADVVEEITEIHMADFFRGNYNSYKEGKRLAREYCGKGSGILEILEKMLDKHDFKERENVEFAKRGDVAVAPSGQEGITCGICMNHKIYTVGPDVKLGKIPLEKALKAWEIK